MTTAIATRPAKPKRRSRKSYNRTMKVIRRIHMYLGLILVPWVLLFGVSGFLFNHTSTFWGGNVQTLASLDSREVLSQTDLQPLDIDAEMQEVLRHINASGDSSYQLKGSPWLSGHLRLTGKAGKQTVNLSVDPTDGSAVVTTTASPAATQEKPDFDGQSIPDGTKLVESVNASFAGLLAAKDITFDGPLATPSRGSNAEIRFVLTDSDGRDWRGSYNLASSTLSGVADDSASGYNFTRAVTRLHKTHHYPDTFGARWVWSLVGDITALSMILWGLTGLVMWWQIQPSRVVGTIAVFAAAIIAFFIFSGTLADYSHNPVQVRSR